MVSLLIATFSLAGLMVSFSLGLVVGGLLAVGKVQESERYGEPLETS